MTYETYKILHIVGLLLVFLGLGGQLVGSGSGKFPAVLHGLGMVVLLVAGFGLLARLGASWPWAGWVWGKVVVWLVIGALPALHKKKVLPDQIAWIAAVAIGGAAAWLAIAKPF